MREIEPFMQKLQDMQFQVAAGSQVDEPALKNLLMTAAPHFLALQKDNFQTIHVCAACLARGRRLYSRIRLCLKGFLLGPKVIGVLLQAVPSPGSSGNPLSLVP